MLIYIYICSASIHPIVFNAFLPAAMSFGNGNPFPHDMAGCCACGPSKPAAPALTQTRGQTCPDAMRAPQMMRCWKSMD